MKQGEYTSMQKHSFCSTLKAPAAKDDITKLSGNAKFSLRAIFDTA